MSCMEVRSYSYFWQSGYFRGPCVSFVTTDEISRRVTKIYLKDWCLINSQPTFLFLTLFVTQYIIVISSKGCKPENFEPYISLKLSFANIRGLHSNFVECESCLESNSLDILALCGTNLYDCGNFSVSGIFL